MQNIFKYAKITFQKPVAQDSVPEKGSATWPVSLESILAPLEACCASDQHCPSETA
jgi:hypothetical protein